MTQYLIDGLQYANWSRKIFEQMRISKVSAIHATIAYHEDFKEMVQNIIDWNRLFERHGDLILHGYDASDIDKAISEDKTAIFFGFQTPAPIEANIGLIEIVYQLGVRFMQLTYNNQSLLACGCYESEDSGITRMGKQVIKEMNRVGLIIDMSHSSERSTLEAISLSQRPIAITHANPSFWCPALRNKSHEVMKTLAENGGIIGFSLYPHHLKDKSQCRLESFCQMVMDCADLIGIDHIALGSDLCQDHSDKVVEWMRVGRWTKDIDYGEGSKNDAGFPPMPSWFQNNLDFHNIRDGLCNAGMDKASIDKFMGGNWYRFFKENFIPIS